MGIAQHFRSSFRSFRKSPAFVLVAVLTLGLGIGANIIMFSVVQAVFLHSMNFPDGERLMFISRGYPGFPQGGGNFTYPAYRDLLQQNTTLDALGAFQPIGPVALTEGNEPVRVNVSYVTPNYLDLLGAPTELGRTFRHEEDRWGEADPVIVLSHGFWQREFASAPDIVGRTVHLNQQAFTVVGVTQESFRDAPGEIDSGEPVDAWIPLGRAYALTGYSNLNDRNGAVLWGVGRLKAGVTAQQARADFDSIGKKLAQAYPATDSGFTMVAIPLKNRLVGSFYNPVWLLVGGSVFILLIGCANVANLLLARLVARQRELAVRAALGATPFRLALQMLTENLFLVILAAVLGTFVAMWGLHGLRTWGSANLPSVVHFHVDRWMPIASVMASVVTLLLCGLGPALVGARVDLRDTLNQSGRQGASLGRRRAAKLLIVSEVSLALVLLVGAGLLLKSFRQMTKLELGFNSKNLLTLRLDVNSDRYTSGAERTLFAKALRDKLGAIPGVQSAILWGPGMPGRETWVVEAIPEGRQPDDPRSIVMSGRHSVNPGALAAMGIPILRGRDFTWHDDPSTPLVAIVSEDTAKASWPGEDPIGKRFRPIGKNKDLVTVVGVARNAVLRQRFDMSDAAIGILPGGLLEQPDVYLPYPQRPNGALVFALRIQGDAGAIVAAVRTAVRSIDPTLPVYDVALLEDRLAAQDGASLALTMVTVGYALLALFLASLGLFGVLSHAVSRRTQEIGVRMALGAKRGDVMLMVVKEGVLLTGFGVAVGLLGSVVLTRMMTSLLFGVSSTDASVYLGISLLLMTVAVAACYLPARRATRVDPMEALRYE